MSPSRFLIDTSGLVRILQRDTRAVWEDHLTAGIIAVCPVVELEFLYSARSLADRLDKVALLRQVFAWVPMADHAYDRAAEVQAMLTRVGHHRSAGAVDLLIAATAERANLTILTDDRDFTSIAGVTGQPVLRVAG
ncbi:MAG: PIN domain nuclease [Tetrasphaera sp.]|nr:PIN domain nuclease [Tetrasphaera sp.]HRY11735.1 PIN domain nuclease [Candidatus Nanopelagicales bacterium]